MKSELNQYERIVFIFQDSLIRVYQCFSDLTLLNQFLQDTFKYYVEIKDSFTIDSPNTTFFIKTDKDTQWISNVISTHKSLFYITSTHHYSYSLSNITTQYSFYYNTIENETLLIIKKTINDPDLSKEIHLTHKHLTIQMCQNIQQYLNQTRKRIEQVETILLYQSIDKIWLILSHYDTLINALFINSNRRIINNAQDIVKTGNKVYIQIDEKYKLKIIVRRMILRNNKIKCILDVSGIECNVPRQMIKCFVDKINTDITIFSYIHHSLDAISYPKQCLLRNSKRNMLKLIRVQ